MYGCIQYTYFEAKIHTCGAFAAQAELLSPDVIRNEALVHTSVTSNLQHRLRVPAVATLRSR